MKTLNKFIVSIALLCLSQTAFAACNDADAYDDCIEITGDENDSIGSGTGGGGSLGFGGSGGGGSDGGSDGGNGSGGGAGQGDSGENSEEEEAEEEEDPKLALEECKQASARKLATCNAAASEAHTSYMRNYCDDLIVIVFGFNGSGFTNDTYAKCRNRSLDNKENKERVCNVFHQNRVYQCY